MHPLIADVLEGRRDWAVVQGCSADLLAGMPEGVAQSACTSPPYWSLRSYLKSDDPLKPLEIGGERTPAEYAARLTALFAQLRRVLRPDGTFWLNMGDTFSTYPHGPQGANAEDQKWVGARVRGRGEAASNRSPASGLRDKEMVGVPWLLARAMQEDGWLLRCDIVWIKPSAMPSSVSGWRWEQCRKKVKSVGNEKEGCGRTPRVYDPALGGQRYQTAEWESCPGCKKCSAHGGLVLRRGCWRPTVAHEYIFQFAKSNCYFGDGEPVRTQLAEATISRDRYSRLIDDPDEQFAVAHDHETVSDPEAGANLRSWWPIGGEPLRAKHYAAFPSAIPRICFLASTPERGSCPACGAPWARVIERQLAEGVAKSKTVGWRPTCTCPPHEPRPALVIDPFCGSGRSGIAARRLGLRFVGLELNPEYVAMARRRICDDNPMFNLAALEGL